MQWPLSKLKERLLMLYSALLWLVMLAAALMGEMGYF